jgi:uncharacterized protein
VLKRGLLVAEVVHVGAHFIQRWGMLAVALCLVGCTTYAQRVTQVRSAYYDNGFATADLMLQTAIQKDRVNADVLKLDQAMIQLVGGDPRAAEQTLRSVRDRFEELEKETLSEKTLTYLWDDTRRPYAGEDHERVLLRAFLALSNLMHDGSDAEAYCLQMLEKQQQIIDAGQQKNGENPKLNYPRVALSPYLRGIMREAMHNSYDDAHRSYELVTQWQPTFLPARVDLQRTTQGRHSARGNGVLYVFALVGRGAYKEAVNEVPTSASLLIAGEIVSALGEHTLPPNVAAIQVPRMVAFNNEIQGVAAYVNRHPVGYTETVTDVTQMAIEQNRINHPHVMARAVARRFLKKGLIYGTKEMTGTQRQSLSNVALDVAGIVWEATEHADTRCWGLLPDKIQVLRVELPAGEHEIALHGVHRSGGIAQAPALENVRIADGRNTYLLASFPHLHSVGKVLVSEP